MYNNFLWITSIIYKIKKLNKSKNMNHLKLYIVFLNKIFYYTIGLCFWYILWNIVWIKYYNNFKLLL